MFTSTDTRSRAPSRAGWWLGRPGVTGRLLRIDGFRRTVGFELSATYDFTILGKTPARDKFMLQENRKDGVSDGCPADSGGEAD